MVDYLTGLLMVIGGTFCLVASVGVVRLPDTYRVDPTNGLAGELRVLLGPESVLAS